MIRSAIRLACVLLLISPATRTAHADEEPRSIKDVAATVRDSILVVTTEDQPGRETGLGTGFVVDPRGLIATSLHVISQSRPIWVQTRNGRRYPVTEVHASDRNFDLAILRIEPEKPLQPIPLGHGRLETGEVTVAIGHPLGLKHSVVSGVIAGEREFDGKAMWQIAMAIEPGNSGGPLLDREGRVQGVITMKSVGESFGFAVKVGLLRKLIESPNPTAMEHWPTSVRLNPSRWTAKMGARWTQRGGSIQVDSAGRGFGGRSLLLRVDELPQPPFELAVSVKLADESGAAGLVFHSDGDDRHYGFYPSNGSLRLTNFNGPSVFTWNVLREVPSPSYKPGQWNEIRVRVEETKITGFVNNHLVTTIDNVQLPVGQIGLCKFRDTKAEFRNFRFGKEFTSHVPSSEALAELLKDVAALPKRDALTDDNLETLLPDVSSPLAALDQQARELESKAAELRQLRDDLHTARVCKQLRALAEKPDEEIDIFLGTLLISKLDNPEIDIAAYLELVDELSEHVRKSFPTDATDQQKCDALSEFLFRKSGYHGSRLEYYDIHNSHIDRVIDDREGIPITLAVFYMAVADRLGIQVVGVGLPGHFVVRHEPQEGEPQLIDVFDGGVGLSQEKADLIAIRASGQRATGETLAAAKPKDILRRVLTNMRVIAQASRDTPALLRYIEALTAITPEDRSYRGLRGILRYQLGRKTAAREDFDWLLEHAEQLDPIQLRQIQRIREQMDAR